MKTPAVLGIVFTLTCAALAGLIPVVARAAPGDLDTTFQPGDGTIGSSVFTSAVQPDGKIIVAGSFSNAGGNAAIDHVARLNTDGTLDTTFAPGDGTLNLSVNAVAIQPDGKVIVAGAFTNAGGNAAIDCVARLNTDGTLDTTFVPGDGAITGNVSTAVLQPGKVIIGGSFTDAGGNTAIDHVARLNPNGTLDTTFAPGDGTFNDNVYVAALQPDGKIIVAGIFTDAGGIASIDYVARLNPDGTLDNTFASGDGAINSDVWAATLQPDGKVIIGGSFTDAGGNVEIDRVARLNTLGTVDTSFTPGHDAIASPVGSTILQSDGDVVISGWFADAGGDTSIDRIARLNSDGSVDTTFSPGDGKFGSVNAVILQTDGKAVVGGPFTNADGNPAIDSVARLQNGAATSSISFPDLTQIQWQRGGTTPEASFVSFEYSATGTAPWIYLGLGTRVSGGWELTGVDIPNSSTVRALAFIPSGSSSGIVEALTTAITSTWSLHYTQANVYYAYFTAQGDPDSALAYWFYFRAYGDQAYYKAAGYPAYAQFKFYEGLAYFYYTFYKNSAPNLSAYFLYLNFAYAYSDYYTLGNPAGAVSLYSTYYALSLSVL